MDIIDEGVDITLDTMVTLVEEVYNAGTGIADSSADFTTAIADGVT